MNHKKINSITRILVVFILVLGLPSLIALGPSLYFGEAQKTNADSRLNNATYFYENVHDFLVLQKPLAEEFSDEETSHMKDVRGLFNIFRFSSILFFVLLVNYFFFLNLDKKVFVHRKFFLIKNLFVEIKKSSVISLMFFSFLTLTIFVSFNVSFDLFHNIFFPQGNWLFSADSLLITLFPQFFFFNMAKKIFFISLGIISIIFLCSFLLEKNFKKMKNKFC